MSLGMREWRLRAWRDPETGEDRLDLRMGECARLDMEVLPAVECALLDLVIHDKETEDEGGREIRYNRVKQRSRQ